MTNPSAESVFAVISGVPSGTLFSHGFNNGPAGTADGSFSWSIPVADLANLMITPPTFFAGLMNLTLTGIALEMNLNEATNSESFQIDISPVSDPLLTLAENVNVDTMSGGVVDLTLNVRLEDTESSDYVGETLPETAIITFDDVPAGVFFRARSGGSFVDNDGTGGQVTFRGTEAQANDLELVIGPIAGPLTQHEIQMMSVTQDAEATSTSAVVSDRFQVTSGTFPGSNEVGAAGTGSVSNVVILDPGVGSISASGVSNTFVLTDMSQTVVISGFTAQDQVDVSNLIDLDTFYESRQPLDISRFVQLMSGTLSVSMMGDGSFQDVASGLGILGSDIEAAYASGAVAF